MPTNQATAVADRLSSICDANHAARVASFYARMVPPDMPMCKREPFRQEARRRATAEMLDEIHLMLRMLLDGRPAAQLVPSPNVHSRPGKGKNGHLAGTEPEAKTPQALEMLGKIGSGERT